MDKSFFITFEGTDGSGKTTIINMVEQYFIENKYNYIKTREPGGSLIAEKIRDIILDTNNTSLASPTEALLYAASRAQHFEEVIKPALDNNKIVLCDRFIDSSLVYQGIARNLGIDNVLDINKFAINDVMPNLTIFFDVKPSIGIERINKASNREINRLDLEGITFHNKVYEGYLKLYSNNKDRIVRIDATKSIEEVFNDTIKVIEDKYHGII